MGGWPDGDLNSKGGGQLSERWFSGPLAKAEMETNRSTKGEKEMGSRASRGTSVSWRGRRNSPSQHGREGKTLRGDSTRCLELVVGKDRVLNSALGLEGDAVFLFAINTEQLKYLRRLWGGMNEVRKMEMCVYSLRRAKELTSAMGQLAMPTLLSVESHEATVRTVTVEKKCHTHLYASLYVGKVKREECWGCLQGDTQGIIGWAEERKERGEISHSSEGAGTVMFQG